MSVSAVDVATDVPPVAVVYHLIAVPVAIKFETFGLLLSQKVCVADPVGADGTLLLVTTTSSVVLEQVPLEIVHLNVALVPAGTPVTVVFLKLGVVIVPVPLILDHAPVPLVGLLPAKVNVPLPQLT